MNIYVDFDDCLCETAVDLSRLCGQMFGKFIPYEDVKFFDLQQSFSLNDDEFKSMMEEAHRPEVLLALEETDRASEVVNKWIDRGHKVSIITGRPFISYDASRRWLDEHGLLRPELFCLNKYGRDNFLGENTSFSLEIEDYLKMKFDFAVEDSPLAFKYLTHLPDLKVMVFDRPWNKGAAFPNDNYRRCSDWTEIEKEFEKQEEEK